MILHPYTKLTTPSMGFSGDSYNPLTGLEEEEAYLFYTDHAKMLESSIVDHPPMFYQVNCSTLEMSCQPWRRLLRDGS